MHLSEVLNPDMFWPNLGAKTKPEVIRELSEKISVIAGNIDAKKITEILMERERLGSTGIQDGIAIPHGKVPGLEKIILACGISNDGIDFDSHDQKPTKIFFVLLAPEFAAGQHLKVLARLSKLLKEERIREELISAEEGAKMYNFILKEDEQS